MTEVQNALVSQALIKAKQKRDDLIELVEFWESEANACYRRAEDAGVHLSKGDE